jgi:predicted amidohydrolase YtcJ
LTGKSNRRSVTNGKVYTVKEAQPWSEAVAIKDGLFILVGSNADVAAVTGEESYQQWLKARSAVESGIPMILRAVH